VQQVSAIDPSIITTATGISSPTVSEPEVSSRVTVRDEQEDERCNLIAPVRQ
jgi:hypothetical protein